RGRAGAGHPPGTRPGRNRHRRRHQRPTGLRYDHRGHPGGAGAHRRGAGRRHRGRPRHPGQGGWSAVAVRGAGEHRRADGRRRTSGAGAGGPAAVRLPGVRHVTRASSVGFTEVADGVYVLRYPVLDVNVTLVTGDGHALLVDTLSTDRQARQLAEAARRITRAPWTIVNTHHHFDHCFGNATLVSDGQDIWAEEETVAVLSQQAETVRRYAYEAYAESNPDFATELAQVRVLPPGRVVRHEATVTVGGRPV